MNTQPARYAINENTCMIFRADGSCIPFTKGHPDFNRVRLALLKGDVEGAIKASPALKDMLAEDSNFEVIGGGIFYRGVQVPEKLAERVRLIWSQCGSVKPYALFEEKRQSNVSARSGSELYDFMLSSHFSLTDRGTVIGYKGVRNDNYSVMGNTKTRVLSGTVDKDGHILNSVGATIEVMRQDVDDDRCRECSYGLHVGSFEYASNWGEKMLLVEFDPADAVSVPKDHMCMKLRVCKYKVLQEVDRGTFLKSQVSNVSALAGGSAGAPTESAIRAKAMELIRDNPAFKDESELYAFLLSNLLMYFGCNDSLVEREVEQIMLERQKAAKAAKVEVKAGAQKEPKSDVKSGFEDRIKAYVRKRGTVTLRQIQSSLSPVCPNLDEIEHICISAGLNVDDDTLRKGDWSVWA